MDRPIARLEIKTRDTFNASAQIYAEDPGSHYKMVATIYVDDLSELDELVAVQNLNTLFANARKVLRVTE